MLKFLTAPRSILLVFTTVACVFLSLHGLTDRSQATSESAYHFVVGFYKWYVPVAGRDNGTTAAWAIALKEKPALFCAPLAHALGRDIAALSKAQGLASLDYDPFLDTQDAGEHYEVSGVKSKGLTYLVDVYRLESGKRTTKKPQVAAELQKQDDHWCFVNFHYADGRNLATELKRYEAERTKGKGK